MATRKPKITYVTCFVVLTMLNNAIVDSGFPGGASGKEPACQYQRLKRQWVGSLGQEDPLEEGTTTHSSIFSWRIPMDGGVLWTMVHRAAKNQTRLKQLSTRARAHTHTHAHVLDSSPCFMDEETQAREVTSGIIWYFTNVLPAR